jgi:hypothetical protein
MKQALRLKRAGVDGYITTTEQVQALFDTSSVTEQEAHDVTARMGLVLVQPTGQNDGN